MKLIYKGKFNGDMESLPHHEHQPGAVKFKEFDSPKKMAIVANIVAIIVLFILILLYFMRCETITISLFSLILPFLVIFPHEFLHAICFKDEVYLYTNWKQGMAFVVGPETMSKGRFIFMSLLPNILFGFIPYIAAMINPSLNVLGIFGAISISMGVGDYYNVINGLTQMPKGARTYLHKFNSYWYMP